MRRFAILLAALAAVASGCFAKAPEAYSVKVLNEYPHDAGAYTQGLFFYGGSLYESTGQWGQSSFRKVDLETGKVLEKISFNRKYFGEGSAMLGDNLYILTWTNRVIFVYDANTLKYKQTYSYPREGWGLTTNGKSLIASDGSSKIYFLSPELKLERTLDVRINGRPLKLLNELEWIDGRIWANVYTTETIVVINPETGAVEKAVDCSGLLPESLRKPSTDVLNGIAVSDDGRIFLTGKNWPRMYEIKLEKKK